MDFSGVLDWLQFSRSTHFPSSSYSSLEQKHPTTHMSRQPLVTPLQDGGQALPHCLKILPGGHLGGGKTGRGREGGGGGGISGRRERYRL